MCFLSAWQSGTEVDLESRITKMIEMFEDFQSLGLTKKADTKEEIDSNLASAEQTLSNLTTTVLEPILALVKKITDYLKDFTFQTHVIEPFFKGLKSLFTKLSYVGWVFEDNPTPPPKNKNKVPEKKESEDKYNDTP
ncbi:hypothetical protein DB299_04855 (plasmid) [Borreliella bavariensis PBi]|uniref:Uncharacterized protein n=2 Tax=Borrelia garinii subsp. bavariensis (strain ATCC BAA-2496 / DSM 23469 / PBi) TaxID=290434 RepID=A0ABM7ATL2_BORGP|nr:hypothetical protein DB299_04855 [Borreliella bavariensis PBi]